MNKEYIRIKRKETSVKLQASAINSIRIKDIVRNAVRVYKDDKLGIAGAIGSTSIADLEQQAETNLAANIPYPYPIEANHKDHRDYRETNYTEQDIMTMTETLLNELNKEYDDFIYSESLQAVTIDYTMTNTAGLDLRYQDEYVNLGFVVKAKQSANLFDTFISWSGRKLDLPRLTTFAKQQLKAERNLVDLPEGDKVPVFFADLSTVGGYLVRQLNGETYGNKASLFDGKLGEKLFHDKLNVVQDDDPKTSFTRFFDAEGVTKENDRVPLITDGVLTNVFTDKKNAAKFDLPHTGSASGGYDDVPRVQMVAARPLVDSKDIAKTLNGKPAIFVMVSAGGDFTAEGHYATPVQAAYLFDGKQFIGKLPNFNMNNSIYKMLGEDYIGTFQADHLYFSDDYYVLGCYMNVKSE